MSIRRPEDEIMVRAIKPLPRIERGSFFYSVFCEVLDDYEPWEKLDDDRKYAWERLEDILEFQDEG